VIPLALGDLAADSLIFQDDFLLVANKPSGLLAVPGRGADKQDCLSARIQKQCADALVVHRLDMSTSGLMLFARGTEMQRRLSEMFRARDIEKRYVAIVAGKLEPNRGEINLPLAADWEQRPRQKVDMSAGKPSLTRYCVLCFDPASNTSRVLLEPVTGRTHQLRVHLAASGHPILGDTLYDARAANRLMLHAEALSFNHPQTGALLNFQSPTPF